MFKIIKHKQIMALIFVALFSTPINLIAGAVAGQSFITTHPMVTETNFNDSTLCQDDVQTITNGPKYTRVTVITDGTNLPRNLKTNEYDKYSIFKPANTRAVSLSAETLQSNYTYSQELSATNYGTVNEYLANEPNINTVTNTRIAQSLTFEESSSTFLSNGAVYLYLGIPPRDYFDVNGNLVVKEQMVISNVVVTYLMSNISCAELSGSTPGIKGLKGVAVTDSTDKIILTWNAAAANSTIAGYMISVKTADGSTDQSDIEVSAGKITYTVGNLTADTEYTIEAYAFSSTDTPVGATVSTTAKTNATPNTINQDDPTTSLITTGTILSNDGNFNFHLNELNLDGETVYGGDFSLAKNDDGTSFRREDDADNVYYFRVVNVYDGSVADVDGDGVTVAQGDCNDNDSGVYPDDSGAVGKDGNPVENADETGLDKDLNCQLELPSQ